MVGNNGLVWISEKCDIPLMLKAIKLIESKAHKSGLTDEVAAMLKAERGARPVPEGGAVEGGAEGEAAESGAAEGTNAKGPAGGRQEGERYV